MRARGDSSDVQRPPLANPVSLLARLDMTGPLRTSNREPLLQDRPTDRHTDRDERRPKATAHRFTPFRFNNTPSRLEARLIDSPLAVSLHVKAKLTCRTCAKSEEKGKREGWAHTHTDKRRIASRSSRGGTWQTDTHTHTS